MTQSVCVVGAGPAGLMAAEVLSGEGMQVDVFDGMPSVGRKFLLAGKGGLNLTHSESAERFASRYGARSAEMALWLEGFGAHSVREWAHGLGVETFVGTSGRVFPVDMKAAPLLRAWLHRLRSRGVHFHMRHRWTGWSADGSLQFQSPQGPLILAPQPTVLALGGASWSRLGSDGAWVALLAARGIPITPLRPANCGFDVWGGWSPVFAGRFAGQPFKSVAVRVLEDDGSGFARKGEFVATATGVEGSLIYAASALLRDQIQRHGQATLEVDLLPDRSLEQVLAQVNHPRGARSLSSHLKSRLGLDGIKMGLLFERLAKPALQDPIVLARAIKGVPLVLGACRPLDEAISTAGGVPLEELDAQLMLHRLPGVFVAGEMLDWEAPTGGYLLTACMSSGRRAALGLLDHLRR